MEVTLAIADVHAIVARTPDRFLVTNAAEHGHAGRRERGIQRPEEAAREPVAAQGRNVVGSNGNPWIDVDGFVLVQAEHVNVFRLDHRLRGNRPGIPAVPFFSDRVAIVRIHDAASGAGVQSCRRRRNGWQGIHAITPDVQCAGRNRWRAASGYSRHGVAAADGERRLKDGRVALLLHEQGDVLEGIAVVYSETPTEDMIPVAGQIISEPYARAEVLIVIARLLAHQGRCQGAEGGGGLKLLEGAAVGNIRSSHEIVIILLPMPTVNAYPAGIFVFTLEVQSELLRIPNEELRIADRDAHPHSSIVAGNQVRT